MNKPRFRPDLHVEVVEPDNVFLLSETAYHTLSGRLYAILAPLIDGRRSVEQIARALSPAVSATQVHYALHRLKERGYVIDADLTLPESEAAYWSLHGKTVLTPLHETINVLSIDVADMLTPYVQQAGLHVDAAAPFTLVAVNDYLNPVLADINAAMLRDKWVKVIGRIRFMRNKQGQFLPAVIILPSPREPLDKLLEVIPQPANPHLF